MSKITWTWRDLFITITVILGGIAVLACAPVTTPEAPAAPAPTPITDSRPSANPNFTALNRQTAAHQQHGTPPYSIAVVPRPTPAPPPPDQRCPKFLELYELLSRAGNSQGAMRTAIQNELYMPDASLAEYRKLQTLCLGYEVKYTPSEWQGYRPATPGPGVINFNALNDRARATLIPRPTPTRVPQPTTVELFRPTATVVFQPTYTPIPRPTPTRLWLKTPTQTPTLAPTPTPTRTPTPTLIPFTPSDGVSPIPVIEAAWAYLEGRVDTDGVYLNRDQMTSIWWGIGDYYALDFERRCLTERGTLAVIDQVMDLDYPGNILHFPDSRHNFYSGSTSFSKGSLSTARRGDWNIRPVRWTLFYPPGLNIDGYGIRHYLWVWVKVNVSTCEPVRDSYSGDFYSVTKSPIPWVEEPENWECIYKPIRKEELGRRDDIDERSYNCAIFRYGW